MEGKLAKLLYLKAEEVVGKKKQHHQPLFHIS